MRKTKREEKFAPTEALQILQSALGYCQKSGIGVKLSRASSKLFIEIDGADFRVEAGEISLCLPQPDGDGSGTIFLEEVPVKIDEPHQAIDVDDK